MPTIRFQPLLVSQQPSLYAALQVLILPTGWLKDFFFGILFLSYYQRYLTQVQLRRPELFRHI